MGLVPVQQEKGSFLFGCHTHLFRWIVALVAATMEELGVLVEGALKFVTNVPHVEWKDTLQFAAQMESPI